MKLADIIAALDVLAKTASERQAIARRGIAAEYSYDLALPLGLSGAVVLTPEWLQAAAQYLRDVEPFAIEAHGE